MLSPEEILKKIGAQVVLGEWRFPFYGKDTVAQMLPLDEWIERRRKIGHSHETLIRSVEEMHREFMAHRVGDVSPENCRWCAAIAQAEAQQ